MINTIVATFCPVMRARNNLLGKGDTLLCIDKREICNRVKRRENTINFLRRMKKIQKFNL